jgi:hypothetical protein
MKIAPAELISVLFVLSKPMKAVFEHPNFARCPDQPDLPFAVAARMLGARDFLRAGFLSGVISGSLDADKLDYMARDSHHAGLPLGLDLDRLISKLEVVIVTPKNAPNKDLSSRAAQSQNNRVFELGISLAGVGAYEQSVIGRVLLYDRLYHHHKIRAAESMARTLLDAYRRNSGVPLTLRTLYTAVSDEAFIAKLGDGFSEAQAASSHLAVQITLRDLYYRAFCFASRFIPLEKLAEAEKRQSRILIWTALVGCVMDPNKRSELGDEILRLATRILDVIPELKTPEVSLEAHDVIVDLPANKVAVRGNDILTRTESGDVAIPNLYFDPEGWSKAYESQKQIGYVFAPRSSRLVVALASRIVFFEKFHMATNLEGEKAAKTVGLVKPEWIDALRNAGLCSDQCCEVLQNPQLVLVPITHLRIPDLWLGSEIYDRLAEVFPAGLPGPTVEQISTTLGHLASFAQMCEKGSVLKKEFLEKDLQEALRNHLRSREVEIIEGAKFGGGETDLLVGPGPGYTVVENKIAGSTDDPFKSKPSAGWQARRYSISTVGRINFVIIGYEPLTEKGLTSLANRIRVHSFGTKTDLYASVILVVPFAMPVPSMARAPK